MAKYTSILLFSLLFSFEASGARSCISIFDVPPEKPKTAAEKLFEKVKYPDADSIEFILAEYEAKKADPESWIENELNFARFIRQATLLKSNEHPIDIYGEENYKAFRDADEYLKTIPQGHFTLTNTVFRRTHALASRGIVSVLKNENLQAVIPDGYLPDKAGVLKKRFSIGRDPLFYPLTDKAVEALQANKWLGDLGGQHGFFEFPLISRPNKRRGVIIYANPTNLRSKLDLFTTEMNAKLELAKTSKYNPALLAAEVQLGLVALHPFVDGNGRTSRLIMDRVLRELNLPPSLIADTSNDLYMTPQEWAEEIQKGLRTFVELQKHISSPTAAPQIGAKYTSVSTQNEIPPEVINKLFFYKGAQYSIYIDGFIYDQKGIPHVFKNNTLYPIADNTYLLYVMSNKNRQFSASSRDIFKSNFEFYQKSSDNNNTFHIVPYSTIRQANKNGTLFLYPWQKDLMQDLLTIDTTEPNKILNLFGSLNHTFKKSGAPAVILAEYEKIDHQLWTIKKSLDARYAAEIQLIETTRETIFNAAKTLITQKLDEIKGKLGDDFEMVRTNEVSYKIFEMIYKKSKLSRKSYSQALKEVDDNKIYLLRSDSVFVEKIGFISQMNFKNLLKSLPFYTRLRNYLITLNNDYFNADDKKKKEIIAKWTEYAERIKNEDTVALKLFNKFLFSRAPEKYRSQFTPENIGDTFRNFSNLYALFVERILTSKYKNRGILDQYDRAFIDNILQMGGGSPEKPGKSFSSNSGLYMEKHEPNSHIPFTNSKYDSGIYLVEIDRGEIVWNEYSIFSQTEYEFVIKKRIPAKRIVEKIRLDDYKQRVSLGKEKHDEIKASLNPYSFGGSLQIKEP